MNSQGPGDGSEQVAKCAEGLSQVQQEGQCFRGLQWLPCTFCKTLRAMTDEENRFFLQPSLSVHYAFPWVTSFIPAQSLGQALLHPHLMPEETEAQRGEVYHPQATH